MTENPYPQGSDRAEIWEILMRRDFQAFAAQDWSAVAGDFDEVRFLGIDAKFTDDPNLWVPTFHELSAYRDAWLQQAAESAQQSFAPALPEQLLAIVTLDRIDIAGKVAVAHKKFDGNLRLADGGENRLNWQTLYYLRHDGQQWKITGFTGYMKYRED